MAVVSVIMPMYNARQFVPEAIHSILGQTLADFELIVVDNGSDDGSLEYAQSIPDPRVRVIRELRRGAARAINAGISASRAELLAVMDSDDIVVPKRLEIQFEFMRRNPDVALVGTRFAFLVRGETVPVPPQPSQHAEIRAALLRGMPVICNGSTMFRSRAAAAVGGHSLNGPAHDLDFFLRVSEIGCVRNIPALLYYYRVHANSTSMSNISEIRTAQAFAVACALARQRGEPEPVFQEFLDRQNARFICRRFADRAGMKSAQLYRRAILRRAAGCRARAVVALGCSALLDPRRAILRIRREIGLC